MTQRPRILVVEDDDMVGTTIKSVLDERYDVICASEVARALAEIAAQPIDVVLVDYCLHAVNGTVVAERAEGLGVPVVWMTGDSAAMDALAGQRCALLLKPFHLHELLEALAKAVAGRPLSALDAV